MHISRVYIRTLSFAYIRRKNILEKCLLFPEKLRIRETFERWECICPFYFPSNGNPSMRANRGSAAQARQQSLKQHFP